MPSRIEPPGCWHRLWPSQVFHDGLEQQTGDTGDWEPWILYMLQGVELTARQTIWTIGRIKALMMDYKHRIRAELPKIYSQDLLNNLFRHPYTKVEALQTDLRVSRLTATKYLDRLTNDGSVDRHKVGRYNYYINFPLMGVFAVISDQPAVFDVSAMDRD